MDIQEHNGIRYYSSHQYGYYRSGPKHGNKRMQRVVYSDTYGNIPHGWDVHHIDGDKSNNALENLVALSRADHLRLHPRSPKKRVMSFKCETCSAAFEAVHSGTNRFCSNRCRNRWHYQQAGPAVWNARRRK